MKGSAVLLTEGIHSLRLDGIIAITHGKLGELINLTIHFGLSLNPDHRFISVCR